MKIALNGIKMNVGMSQHFFDRDGLLLPHLNIFFAACCYHSSRRSSSSASSIGFTFSSRGSDQSFGDMPVSL